jgi:hypothetical protein
MIFAGGLFLLSRDLILDRDRLHPVRPALSIFCTTSSTHSANGAFDLDTNPPTKH